MYFCDLRKYDVSNWNGINSTLFVSGCNFHCKGCWNKEAQDFNYGKPYTREIENTFIEYINDKHVDGACLLGGEIFHQDLDIILHLVKRIKSETNKPIHVWTGYKWEQLLKDDKKVEILKHIDTLVDGQFVLELRDLSLKHKGSSNQRVIDVKETLKERRIVLYE